MTKPRSFSQFSQEKRCAYSYYLSRIAKVWKKPAAWSPMGTAVHTGCETWERAGRPADREEALQAFRDSYWSEINRLLEETPNTDYWFASGPYKGPEDIPRRYDIGLEHVERYIDWFEKHPDETVWTMPDGRQALELEFLIDLEGVGVRGFIDHVGYVRGVLRPRDIKSGRKPGDIMQIKLYGLALERYYHHIGEPQDVLYGDFIMTRTGKPTVGYKLDILTEDEVVSAFQALDARINAGDFPAKPSADVCWSCEVRDSCKYRAV